MFLRLYPTEKLLYIPVEQHHVNAITSKVASLRTKMTLSNKSLAGPGYIILNAIRVMNIIALLAVIAASVVMLVKTSVASKFFFFDAVSHVITAITSMFLLTSELSLFRRYFARNWPLLSPVHGFVTLALSMIVLGLNILGNLNKPATSQKSLGLAFWRIVIASGILVFILGFVNLIASYVFRDRKQGITARQVRAHGAVAVHMTPKPNESMPSAPTLAQNSIPSPFSPTKSSSNPFRFITGNNNNRQSLLPSYHTASSISSPSKTPLVTASPMREPVSPSSKYSRATICTKKKLFGALGRNRESVGLQLPVNVHDRPMEISAPMGVNPQFAHLVQRPDSAMHPSRTGESEAFRWKA